MYGKYFNTHLSKKKEAIEVFLDVFFTKQERKHNKFSQGISFRRFPLLKKSREDGGDFVYELLHTIVV